MADKRVTDYIADNLYIFRGLVKLGLASSSALASYSTNLYFEALGPGIPIMERYTITAKAKKVSESYVRKAVRDMNKKA